MGVQLYPLVTTTKQGVVLGGVLATNTSGPGRQFTQWLEGDAKAFGSHGRGTRFKILIPKINKNCIQYAAHFYAFSLPHLTHFIRGLVTWQWSS